MTFTQFVTICAKGIYNYYLQTVRPVEGTKRKIEIWFRDFTTGIDNLLQWFPIIWCDRYWDSHYLFVIMKKKLMNMEKGIREADIHVDAQSDAARIQICIDCLDRLIKDEYHDVAFKDHDKKWGDLKMELRKRRKFGQVLISRPNAITEEQIQQEIEESKKCWEFADILQKNDLALLCEIIQKESLRWWD
jgi:hypothetical protein